MNYNELSLQEQEILNRLRRMVAYERIEIMKDDKGGLNMDVIFFRAHKERITGSGKVVPMQLKSKFTGSGE